MNAVKNIINNGLSYLRKSFDISSNSWLNAHVWSLPFNNWLPQHRPDLRLNKLFISPYRDYALEGVILITCIATLYSNLTLSMLSVFLSLLAIDGIYSTIAFLRLHANNLTQSQIIEKIGVIYEIDLIDRYVYYFSVALIFQYVRLVLWLPQSLSFVWATVLLLLTVPPKIINYHTKTWLKSGIQTLERTRVIISKTFCAFCLARIINFLSLTCVDLKPQIHTRELYPLMKPSTLRNTPKTLLNFLIATLVQYTQNNGRTLSSRLIRMVYRYNTGKKIASVKTQEEAKTKLVRVLLDRKFNELIRPDTLQTFFYLYQAKEDGLLYTFFTEFEYRFLQIGSLFTLSKSIFGVPAYVTAIFSACLVIYRNWYHETLEHRGEFNKSSLGHENRHEQLLQLLIGRVLALIVGIIWPDSYFLTIIVAELTYYVLIQFELRIIHLVTTHYASPNVIKDGLSSLYQIGIPYETRYMLIGLLLSKNANYFSSALCLLVPLLLGPDRLTTTLLFSQSLLLMLSNGDFKQFLLFAIQSIVYGYFRLYFVYSITITNNDLTRYIKVDNGATMSTNDTPIFSTTPDFNLLSQLQESYYPTETETMLAKDVDSIRVTENVKNITDMSDDELRKRISEMSASSLGNNPVITNEAGQSLVRSLRKEGISENALDKSLYFNRETTQETSEFGAGSELYSEY
jgi:hypothetical protein